MSRRGGAESTPPVGLGWRCAHLLALSALAVTQPVLDLLGGSPTFFVAHTAGPAQVLLVCLLAVAVVPVVLITMEVLVSLVHAGWGWRLHIGLIGALGALVAAQTIDRIPAVPVVVVLIGGAALGVVLALAYRRREVVRSVLSALALTPLLFAAVFVFASPVHGLVFPPSVEAAEVRVPGDPPPVYVVVFDELPLASVLSADGERIDADRFPNLARLAGDGLWFPNTTSVAAFTHEAVPAILTGERVHAENVPPTAGGHPRNLLTLLADDYRIEAHEQVTQLCTPALCESSSGADDHVPTSVLLHDLAVVSGLVSLPTGLDGWLPQVDDSWAYFGQGSSPADLDQEADRLGDDRAEFVDALGRLDRVGDYREAVASVRPHRQPTLTFIHTVFPHVPWSYHADGQRYDDPGNPQLDEAGEWTTGFAADLGLQRHLLQAAFADRMLGELLDRVDAAGEYDDALIVFTADHGVSLEAGTNRRLPTADTLPAIMTVPVVVKPPRGTRTGLPARDDRLAETTDLLPTIADLLEVDIPWPVDGQSLVGPERTDPEREIYARGHTERTDASSFDLQPLVDRIRTTFGRRSGRLELYGLGPGRDLVGRPARRLAVDGRPGACWAPETLPTGSVGEVRGALRSDEDGPLAFAVVVDGRVAATSVTYDDGEGEAHRVVALARPGGWDPDGVELWRVVGDSGDPRLVPLPGCR